MIRSHRRGWLCLLALAGCATGQPLGGGGDDDDEGGGPDASPGLVDAGPQPDAQEELPTACTEALAAAVFDFESGTAGWTHGRMPEIAGTSVDWRFDDWEVGSASSVGPGACYGGSSGCWATRLDNYYISCQRAFLRSPQIDLSGCAGEDLKLTFYHWHDFWTDDWDGQTWFDGGIVELGGDGPGWTSPPGLEYPGTIAINPDKGSSYECIEPNDFYVDGQPGYVGSSGGWELVELAIPSELVGPGFQVRFSYSSGVILESTTQNANNFFNAGWYIDDLAIAPGGS